MGELLQQATVTQEAANRIVHDIRSRGLGPGDRYLTAKQAADLLGVSTATCQRAMRLLADREYLSRRRNSGTFIGPNADPQPATLVRTVYILLSPDRQFGALPRDAVFNGLSRELPDTGLHFVVLPTGLEVQYMNELLTGAAAAGQLMGVIAVSCAREVYASLARQSVPVVVIGSVDSADDRLASVDGDERHAGRLLAEHMLGKGYQQFAVLMGELWRPGDNLFLRGIEEVLGYTKLSIGDLRVRSLPHDVGTFRRQFLALLNEVPGRLAVICQNSTFVSWLNTILCNDAHTRRQDIGIAYHIDVEMPAGRDHRFPCTYQTVSAIEMSAIAGKMISQLSSGEQLAERHVVLPMALYDPHDPEHTAS